MTIDINKNSALIDSAASGYSGCGCGNRRYYTKAEIDEMLKGILDPEQIKEILDQMFDEYIESGELEQLITEAIAGLYTNEEIDNMLEELEARMKTWSGEQGYLKDITLTINGTELHNNGSIVIEGVDISGKLDTTAFTQAMQNETARTESTYAKKSEIPSLQGYATQDWVVGQNYLKDITLTINGTPLHNNGSIVIEGGGGEPVDISGKLDTSAFTAYTSSTETWKNNMEDCCDGVNLQLRYLMNQVIYLQEQIDELKGDTGSTGTTEYVEFVFNVLSTTEPAWIAEDSTYPYYDKMIIDDGPEIDFNCRYTFSTTGIHNVKLRLIHSDNMDRGNEIVRAGSTHTGFTHCYLIAWKIPATIESIALHMQRRNDMVESITLLPTTPPTLLALDDMFGWCFNSTSLFYVPASSLNTYKTAPGWSKVADRFRAIE